MTARVLSVLLAPLVLIDGLLTRNPPTPYAGPR